MKPENEISVSEIPIDPDTGDDSVAHLLSMSSASSRDSLMFISLVRTVSLKEANRIAKVLQWDLSALRRNSPQQTATS
jgi:hypothetical protein